ncbi:PAS domain-containing protein [Ramlibacter terrae]|uniref:PAS domain-containing protein n=1 Tax=Ramlibacter terrae TaxID=2732511 RepID=A0ABX6P2M3_9BURK|nr:PAS domain-containing protein [Ramlibacter terrae]
MLFVAGMATAQAALTGLGYQYLWRGQPWWNSVSPPAGICAAAVFGLLFARSFSGQRLGHAADGPRAARAGGGLDARARLRAGLSLRRVDWIVTVLAPVTVGALVVSGVLALRRGHGGARHYLAAWAVLLVGVLTLFLHNTGVLPSNRFTANALLIGSALEMILLSFALADRINVARRFKEQAQARIAAEHAMVEVLSDSQQRLRTVLQERETILENSIVGICFLTPDGRLRWANRAMKEIFGAGHQPLASMERFYLSREQYRAWAPTWRAPSPAARCTSASCRCSSSTATASGSCCPARP